MNSELVGTALQMHRPLFDNLITQAKANGATVTHRTSPGFGPGWYGDVNNRLVVVPSAKATEDEVWALLLERMCLTSPGRLAMTSCEYGAVHSVNVLGKDGKLGVSERRSRLEIRRVDGAFQILHVERVYPPAQEAPYDIRQYRESYGNEITVFKDIGSAAVYVSNSINDYAQAASEFVADALEHQAEELRREMDEAQVA